ncbi:hypothetical protein V8E55_009523 [Tylopilus felleus]
MKKMAARDFEDIIQVWLCPLHSKLHLSVSQCAIPVFNGFLPEPHNSDVLQLLFQLPTWHSLTKLWVHTDETLQILDNVTATLGAKLRSFQSTTCTSFSTKELKQETEGRYRRQVQLGVKTLGQSKENVLPAATRNEKTFNLQTYKLHVLGDYTETIRRYGTTDSYSTQPEELEHRIRKSRFTWTSRKAYTQQLTQIEWHQVHIRQICAHMSSFNVPHEKVPKVAEEHHIIRKSHNYPKDLRAFT